MKLLMLAFIFVLFGAFFIISENNLAMSQAENQQKFISLYEGWVDGLISNAASISGYVVKMEWLPKN